MCYPMARPMYGKHSIELIQWAITEVSRLDQRRAKRAWYSPKSHIALRIEIARILADTAETAIDCSLAREKTT